MFKLFKNFLPADSDNNSDSAITRSNSNSPNSWSAKIAQADELWEQGKLSEALTIYGLALEKNPNLVEIQYRLAERLKQQGDLAKAYEKLATGLKNQGKIEQAANYYRQAIYIKTLTGNTKEQLLRSSVTTKNKSPIPIASLKEAAFSFQPLANSALTKNLVTKSSVTKSSTATLKVEPKVRSVKPNVEHNDIFPSFTQKLKAVNPQQAKDIDWETAQVYLQKALEHLDQQQWEKSALACKQATKILPTMAEAYKIWGNALQRMGKTGEAMSCYAKAVEIKPNLAEVYSGIADIYAQQEKWQAAVKHYQKAIIIRPSAEMYRNLADVWRQLGELDKAELNIYKAKELESFQTSVSSPQEEPETFSDLDSELNSAVIRPSQPERSVAAYCRIAEKLEERNQWKLASQYYRQALDLTISQSRLPPSPPVIKEQESTQYTSVQPQLPLNQPSPLSSREDGTNITSSHGGNIAAGGQTPPPPYESWLSEGVSEEIYGSRYRSGRRQKKVDQHLSKPQATNSAHDNADLAKQRLKPHLRLSNPVPATSGVRRSKPVANSSKKSLAVGARTPEGQLDRAIKRYHKQSRLQPYSPKIHTDLGNLYARKGKWQYAIACYRKAIELNPKYPKAHLNLARICLKLGRQQEFIKQMQLALALEPKIGSAMDRFYLGNALIDRGQDQQAISFYYKAIVLNPRFAQSYHRLGEVLGKIGKHHEAIKFLRQAIAHSPQDPESYYFLGQQLEIVQDWDQAVKVYSKVLYLEPQYPGASQKLNHALAEKLKLGQKHKK